MTKNNQKGVKNRERKLTTFISIGDDELSFKISFSAQNTLVSGLWLRFSGNLVAETATFGDEKMVKKRVKSTNFISIRDYELSLNASFPTRNTPF